MTRGFRLIVVLAAVACIVATLTLFGLRMYRDHVYYGNVERIRLSILNMESRRPDHVEPQVWEAAVNWLSVATMNICFTPNYTPLESVQGLAVKFERRTSDNVNLDTVEWMWDEFAAASPYGSRYAQSWRAFYLENVAQDQPELLSDSMKDHLHAMQAMERPPDE